mmetsp:Transcript_41314/g.95378  ORF Transcript_41314/g.95378 Transcript_41314/m.95378 type:complete len:320 (+) Transcript_41314:240-1199(+)
MVNRFISSASSLIDVSTLFTSSSSPSSVATNIPFSCSSSSCWNCSEAGGGGLACGEAAPPPPMPMPLPPPPPPRFRLLSSVRASPISLPPSPSPAAPLATTPRDACRSASPSPSPSSPSSPPASLPSSPSCADANGGSNAATNGNAAWSAARSRSSSSLGWAIRFSRAAETPSSPPVTMAPIRREPSTRDREPPLPLAEVLPVELDHTAAPNGARASRVQAFLVSCMLDTSFERLLRSSSSSSRIPDMWSVTSEHPEPPAAPLAAVAAVAALAARALSRSRDDEQSIRKRASWWSTSSRWASVMGGAARSELNSMRTLT